MSVMVSELYEALRSVGVDEERAGTAARAVFAAETLAQLATKDDLKELRADFKELRGTMKADLTDQKADLLKWHVGTLVAITAIYGGLVSVLKLFG